MRTAIFLAGLAIADAIRPGVPDKDPAVPKLYSAVLLACIVMDLVEFIRMLLH
jgi:hypothetical protein